MWELFGDSDQAFRVVKGLSNADGRLEVFGLAEDDSVWRNVENTPYSDDWTGWSPFVTKAGPRRMASPQSIAGLRTLAVNWGGYGGLRAVGAAPDGSAWINEQISSELTWPIYHWAGWRPFSDGSEGQTWPFSLWERWRHRGGPEGLREVVVPSSQVGAPWVAFGLGVDDTVWINSQTYNPPYLRWGRWRDFGEGLTLSTLTFGKPNDYRLEAYGTAPDNTVWKNSMPLTAPTQWSGWQPFGAPGDQFRAVTALRTGGEDDSESDVFALAPDDTIWRRVPGSNDWVQFGDPADRLSTITSYWDFTFDPWNIEVGGTAPDHTIWKATLLPSGQWGPLEPFGSSGDRLQQFTFVSRLDGIHAFGTDLDGVVWRKSQTEPGTWPPP